MDHPTLIVLVMTCALYGLWRSGELRLGQALIAGLLGFYLADSGMAPQISEGVTNVVEWISTWHI
jgi:hypothetical protein